MEAIMKFIAAIFLTMILILTCGCKDEKETDGVLKFQTVNPITSGNKSGMKLMNVFNNPPLVGDTTITEMTSLKLAIGDVWVSQGEVIAGEPDNLQWVKLTSVTNTTLKLFENHTFSPVSLPAGTYKSIKMTFRNIFYRHVVLVSDPTIVYELLETMGSSFDPCDENDTSWAKTNYFSTAGNHNLDTNGLFVLTSAGEKVAGFTIEPGKTALVSWRLGAGVTEPCINYLIDVNGNREWDCGIDYLEEECPPQMQYMWDFVIDYE